MLPYGYRSVLLGCLLALLVILSGFARLCYAFLWIRICFAKLSCALQLDLFFCFPTGFRKVLLKFAVFPSGLRPALLGSDVFRWFSLL